MGWSGPMTHRQFLVWDLWQELQLNRPSRSDYYQMQTAAMMASERVDVNRFVIRFRTQFDKPIEWPFPRMTKEQVSKVSAALSRFHRDPQSFKQKSEPIDTLVSSQTVDQPSKVSPKHRPAPLKNLQKTAEDSGPANLE